MASKTVAQPAAVSTGEARLTDAQIPPGKHGSSSQDESPQAKRVQSQGLWDSADAASADRVRVPSWSHPLRLLPCSLALVVASCVGVGVATSSTIGLSVLLAMAALLVVAAVLVCILWMMGSGVFRSDGQEMLPTPDEDLHVDEVQVTGGGGIGMSVAPGRRRNGIHRHMPTDVSRLARSLRFDVVVSLIETREMRLMGCMALGETVEAEGMVWVHFPIRDKWVPTPGMSKKLLSRVVYPVARWVSQGKRVLVHCNGGKGRTGLVVAAVLLCMGECRTLAQATSRMRAAREGMLRNPLQRLYLRHLIWHRVL